MSFQDHSRYVLSICHQIEESGWKPDYVVGVGRGGMLASVMISHYLNAPHRPLLASLRDHPMTESNLWMAEDAFGYYEGHLLAKKNILLVDDINDTGATFNWIMDDWQSSCFPNNEAWTAIKQVMTDSGGAPAARPAIWNNNVKFAVVVNNLSSQCRANMDFVGFTIDKAKHDVWIEFPFENWWLNQPAA